MLRKREEMEGREEGKGRREGGKEGREGIWSDVRKSVSKSRRDLTNLEV